MQYDATVDNQATKQFNIQSTPNDIQNIATNQKDQKLLSKIVTKNKIEKFIYVEGEKSFINNKELLREFSNKDNIRKDILIKNHDYYGINNDNRWNSPIYPSEKLYGYYHKKKDEMKPIIEAIHLSEKLERRDLEFEKKKASLQADRAHILDLKKKRKLERLALQLESNQKIYDTRKNDDKLNELDQMDIMQFRNKVIHHSAARELQRKKPQNKWNDYSEICDKHLEIMLGPKIYKNEELATEKLHDSVLNSQYQEYLKDKYKKVMHDVIYYDQKRASDNNRRRYGSLGRATKMNYSLGEEASAYNEKSSSFIDYDHYNNSSQVMRNDLYSGSSSNRGVISRILAKTDQVKDQDVSSNDHILYDSETSKELLIKLFNGRNPDDLDEFGRTLLDKKLDRRLNKEKLDKINKKKHVAFVQKTEKKSQYDKEKIDSTMLQDNEQSAMEHEKNSKSVNNSEYSKFFFENSTNKLKNINNVLDYSEWIEKSNEMLQDNQLKDFQENSIDISTTDLNLENLNKELRDQQSKMGVTSSQELKKLQEIFKNKRNMSLIIPKADMRSNTLPRVQNDSFNGKPINRRSASNGNQKLDCIEDDSYTNNLKSQLVSNRIISQPIRSDRKLRINLASVQSIDKYCQIFWNAKNYFYMFIFIKNYFLVLSLF